MQKWDTTPTNKQFSETEEKTIKFQIPGAYDEKVNYVELIKPINKTEKLVRWSETQKSEKLV